MNIYDLACTNRLPELMTQREKVLRNQILERYPDDSKSRIQALKEFSAIITAIEKGEMTWEAIEKSYNKIFSVTEI